MNQQLPDGYRVKYTHVRSYVNPRPGKFDSHKTLSQKGGRTYADVYDPKDNLVASGIAIVHPKDNYNKKIGREVSLGRALKTLGAKEESNRQASTSLPEAPVNIPMISMSAVPSLGGIKFLFTRKRTKVRKKNNVAT